MAGAYTSPQMLRALELVRGGMTAAAAARETGVHKSSVIRHRIYKEIMAERQAMRLQSNQPQR